MRRNMLFLAGSILAVGFCTGWLLMRALRIDRGFTRLETLVFSMGVGLNAVSTYVLAVGLLGWLNRSLAFVLPGLAVAGLAGWMRFGRKSSSRHSNRAESRFGCVTKTGLPFFLISTWAISAVPAASTATKGGPCALTSLPIGCPSRRKSSRMRDPLVA